MSLRDEIGVRYSKNAFSTTKRGEGFRVVGLRGNEVYVEIRSGDQPIRIATLERAVEIIKTGVRIGGPADFKRLVADERPTYAWAIQRDLGYVSDE
jgi:hypothetical protein